MQIGTTPIEGSEQDEVTRLRRLVRLQLAVFLSILIHLALMVVLVLVPIEERKRLFESEAAREKPPVVITFVNPRPPAPAPSRPSAAQTFPRTPPPPVPRAKPYRMQPAPDVAQPETPRDRRRAEGARGMKDSRPAGGEAGGPLPQRTPGVPNPADRGAGARADGAVSSVIPPPDLNGRLRDFRRALQEAEDSAAKGPQGGGSGPGGADVPSLPSTGFGFGNLEFESRDYDWSDYARAIYVAIWRAWHNRLYLTTGVFERWAAERHDFQLDHNSRIRFTIQKSGQVVGIALETPSGCYPLDDSALDALREVVLPPLPADFPRGEETIHARFIADGDIRAMRSNLDWLKANGFF